MIDPSHSCRNQDLPSPTFWRDRWRQMKHDRLADPKLASAGTYWSNRKNVTDLYIRSRTRQAWQGKVEAQFRAMNIPPGARVLDIGGGTGTHAVPLAAMGCNVTVVEPSAAMREEMEKNISAAGAEPITVIPSRWEDVAPGDTGEPFDIVMASYSLSMEDIGDAITKMQACCRGSVHLFWFLTPPSWARVSQDLWTRLHGREFPGEPLADCLWQALYEMDIYADMTIETKKETGYRSVDEAAREYCQRLDCQTEKEEEILREYFGAVLQPSGNLFILPGNSFSAHIWWRTGSSANRPQTGSAGPAGDQ